MRDDRERLIDIQDAIERIGRYADRGREALDTDELVLAWMIYNVQIIGEACRGLSESFRSAHPEIPWISIIAMRNTMVHRYFAVDKDLLWEAIMNDVPRLMEQVRQLIDASKKP